MLRRLAQPRRFRSGWPISSSWRQALLRHERDTKTVVYRPRGWPSAATGGPGGVVECGGALEQASALLYRVRVAEFGNDRMISGRHAALLINEKSAARLTGGCSQRYCSAGVAEACLSTHLEACTKDTCVVGAMGLVAWLELLCRWSAHRARVIGVCAQRAWLVAQLLPLSVAQQFCTLGWPA